MEHKYAVSKPGLKPSHIHTHTNTLSHTHTKLHTHTFIHTSNLHTEIIYVEKKEILIFLINEKNHTQYSKITHTQTHITHLTFWFYS